ncbi:hypothetical protein IKG20_03135 [Candidatus Saccharibacteria bacterium]|nr:hypothetical protein [Candidatus Saccharibacteria bacterium]
MSIIVARTDEVTFENEMEKMYNRVNAHLRTVPACLEDIVTDRAEKDADRILKGNSTYSVVAPFRNLMKASTNNPDSSYYGVGQKFYKLYCRIIQKSVHERKLSFPEW